MATVILVLAAILLAITVFPWLELNSRVSMHTTDSMAGDEGDD